MSAASGAAPGAVAGTAPRFASPVSTSLDELVGLRALALAEPRGARRRTGAALAGPAAANRLGRGLDFAEVREYRPGDDVRLIDWNVTARTRRPHTKLFVEERERPVHVCPDLRAPMRFATRGAYKSVLGARLAAVIGWRAVADGERTGGTVLADDGLAEVAPAPGRRGLTALFREIVRAGDAAPRTGVPRPRAPRLADAPARLARAVSPGATVWLLSDFADLDARAADALGAAFRTADLVLVHVVDPLDRALPAGSGLAVADAAGRRVEIRSAAQRARYREAFETRRARLEALAARGRHALLTARTDAPFDATCRRVLERDPGGLDGDASAEGVSGG